MKKKIQIGEQATTFYFNNSISFLSTLVDKTNTFILTDENVYQYHKNKIKGFKVIVIKAGELNKQQETINTIITQLLQLGANRQSTLIGIGGGVITDMAGYVASIYMRGIAFGFVPTTILAMVDAAIGGKNGVDIGTLKNMVGTINQPGFLLYDYGLLKSLPNHEWENGFAEIIKHAFILDAAMYKQLLKHTIKHYQKDSMLLHKLIMRNALLKTSIVQKDTFEKAERKFLNFGHTIGHAVENDYKLAHGFAISIGMVLAAKISAAVGNFSSEQKLIDLLQQYNLPTAIDFDLNKALEKVKSDKKSNANYVHFVLLEKIGKAYTMPLTLQQISFHLQPN